MVCLIVMYCYRQSFVVVSNAFFYCSFLGENLLMSRLRNFRSCTLRDKQCAWNRSYSLLDVVVPGMLITVSVVMMLQIWHHGFSHFLLPVDMTVCGKFYLARLFLKFDGCLYAQIGVISNGCLDDVNLL